jgi:hypothetical protein
MKAYELLLHILKTYNPEKYKDIHKGVPYFYIGWTAFRAEDIEKGLFYLDAAVSEDLRKDGNKFNINSPKHSPAIEFLLLDESNQTLAGLELFIILGRDLSAEIKEFSQKSGCNLTIDTFSDNFIKQLFADDGFRTVLSSLYGFVIEFHKLKTMLELRSSAGGSIEPFITHLFKGCLVLETILKLHSKADDMGTLKTAIKTLKFELSIDPKILESGLSMGDVVTGLDQKIQENADYHTICFYTAFGIRNTTGHRLSWEDKFLDNPKLYADLYRRILGAIMWSISKLWIEAAP